MNHSTWLQLTEFQAQPLLGSWKIETIRQMLLPLALEDRSDHFAKSTNNLNDKLCPSTQQRCDNTHSIDTKRDLNRHVDKLESESCVASTTFIFATWSEAIFLDYCMILEESCHSSLVHLQNSTDTKKKKPHLRTR